MKVILLILLALLPILSPAQQTSTPNGDNHLSDANTPQPDSGIRGLLLKWPIKPSSRAGETNSAPMPDISMSLKADPGGAEIARQKTDKNGRFQFTVPPGKYLVIPALQHGMRSRAVKQAVEVKEKQFTNIVITCDTGIR